MKRKRFEGLLFRNTVAIALPAMAVFLVLVFMFIRYPILDKVHNYHIKGIIRLPDEFSLLYADGSVNVVADVKDLTYSGLDYYENGELKASYYYTYYDEMIQFFLVKTTKPKSHIDSISLKGKIIKDGMRTESILTQLAMEGKLPPELFTGMASEYILSEPDYPYVYIWTIYIVFAAPILVNLMIILYLLFSWANPSMHSQAKQLAAYGEIDEVIEDIDRELEEELIFKKNNIFVTSNYLVVSYFAKTDVVKLDMVKYISNNLSEEKSRGRKKVYCVTLSNPDALFYEVYFSSERLADDVTEYIKSIIDSDGENQEVHRENKVDEDEFF